MEEVAGFPIYPGDADGEGGRNKNGALEEEGWELMGLGFVSEFVGLFCGKGDSNGPRFHKGVVKLIGQNSYDCRIVSRLFVFKRLIKVAF